MKEMAGNIHKRIRMIDNFILPALNDKTYGYLLEWVDKSSGVFKLLWSHKNAAKWNPDDTSVFQDWDRLKGHYKPGLRTYHMNTKQRFRAALYKLKPLCKLLNSPDKDYRYYQLDLGSKKKNESSTRPKNKMSKKMHQQSIPTSVICENKSYVSKPAAVSPKPAPSSNMDLTPEEQKVLEQYTYSQQNYNKILSSRLCQNISSDGNSAKNRGAQEVSVLRENSSTVRISHIAAQPAPIHCYSTVKCYYGRNQSPHEFAPEVFVSTTYREPENIPEVKDKNDSGIYTDEAVAGVLNLSLKSEVGETLSR